MNELIKILIYKVESEKSPFDKWLKELDVTNRAIVRARLKRIALGNFGDCKSLGENLWEVRINFGPGYRIYYGQIEDKIILLLSGGDKGSQSRDIEKARKYWSNYKEDL